MSTYTGRTRTLSNNMGNFKTKKVFFSLFGPKQRTKRKAALHLGSDLRSELPSRNDRTRGRQELVPLLARLRQLAALIPRPHTSFGCTAMGFKTQQLKIRTHHNTPLLPQPFFPRTPNFKLLSRLSETLNAHTAHMVKRGIISQVRPNRRN